MTQAEYIRLYKNAHRLSGRVTAQTLKELQKVFIEAGNLAAAQVAATEAGGLSSLTSGAWLQVEQQLKAGADLISRSAMEQIPLGISESYSNYLAVDSKYILDAAKQAGNTLITEAGIANIGIGVDFRLLQIQAARITANGYTFSDRVWSPLTTLSKDGVTKLPTSLNADYQFRIKNLILTGEAQGRDNIKIAEDIQVYIKKGKNEVFKPGRYGKLIPGTGQYARRITRTVDWRALRLIRSELNASLQQSGVLEGVLNPAATAFYDWVKTAGNPIDEDGSKTNSGLRCIDLDRNSPYEKEEVPSYNHPNCSCHVRPVLQNQNEFVQDLKNWMPGDGSNLDMWYKNIYLSGQFDVF